MADLAALKAANAARWAAMMVTPSLTASIDKVAQRLLTGKARYQAIAVKAAVPWAVIAVIHEREAGGKFDRNIAQGDPFNKKSTHVPVGRGPFPSFEDAAYDALVNCAPYAGRWQDWSMAGALTLLEQYNGLGYATKGVPSPYIWASTDQYKSGKYVADHKYDAKAVDKQLGCAALLARMFALDASARFDVTPEKSKGASAAAAIVTVAAGTGTAAAAHQPNMSVAAEVAVIAIIAVVVGTIGVLLWRRHFPKKATP